jgi:hypothetical protein
LRPSEAVPRLARSSHRRIELAIDPGLPVVVQSDTASGFGPAHGQRAADATDWSDAEAARLGEESHRAMRDAFGDGGIGFISDTSRVRHVDNGPRRTWSY